MIWLKRVLDGSEGDHGRICCMPRPSVRPDRAASGVMGYVVPIVMVAAFGGLILFVMYQQR